MNNIFMNHLNNKKANSKKKMKKKVKILLLKKIKKIRYYLTFQINNNNNHLQIYCPRFKKLIDVYFKVKILTNKNQIFLLLLLKWSFNKYYYYK